MPSLSDTIFQAADKVSREMEAVNDGVFAGRFPLEQATIGFTHALEVCHHTVEICYVEYGNTLASRSLKNSRAIAEVGGISPEERQRIQEAVTCLILVAGDFVRHRERREEPEIPYESWAISSSCTAFLRVADDLGALIDDLLRDFCD